jgi:predicted HAD superfamily phosphohydrolase YqeG
MRFTAIFFDWGDTLAPLDAKGVPIASNWVGEMLKLLYHNCYRLAIISNTHRYQDAHWIRKELQKRELLAYFECVISSATYAVHKPDPAIFKKAYEFLQVPPQKVLMVGDSAHCDGGCQLFGSTFLHVQKGEKWDVRLYELLGERLPSGRALSNLYEFNIVDNVVYTKLRHLSEPLEVGSRVLLNQQEYQVTSVDRPITKQDVLKHNSDEWFKFTVVRYEKTWL